MRLAENLLGPRWIGDDATDRRLAATAGTIPTLVLAVRRAIVVTATGARTTDA